MHTQKVIIGNERTHASPNDTISNCNAKRIKLFEG
jgi:hypothetical protein